MTPTPALSVDSFKRWAKDAAPAAKAVFMAMAFAQLERERVDAYIAPILERYAFKRDGFEGKYDDGTIITKTGDLYLSGDELGLKAFYAECDEAHKAHGFKGPQGHCPALSAEYLLLRTEHEFLELAEPLAGINPDRLYGEDRRKYLDLLLKACAPFVKGGL